MARRLVWFAAGAGTGAAGATYLRLKLRRATRRAIPIKPAGTTGARVKAAASEARAALAEGTAAVRRYRAEVARRALEDPPRNPQ
ncbi:hypothetical protein [Candidatus Poriferisocius sp.]|uniref:hypothetical protein n=1 Tax=Candidatus Poriferisocius sp. TaxID=3101276 RepID=UPI003B0269BA